MTERDRRETIAAIATPPGVGGLGIVRVAGPLSRSVLKAIACVDPEPRVAIKALFRDSDSQPIDHGIVLFFKAPESYTGDDIVEFHGHGGPTVLSGILRATLQAGARMARPGEFTERAFLNGKIDLAQAEAVADLISAGSLRAARSALRSLRGDFSDAVNTLAARVLDLRIRLEASLDFPEESLEPVCAKEAVRRLTYIDEAITSLLDGARRGAVLTRGIEVVIAGPPNVGKSTLLNRLLRDDRAIVSNQAGTTRDVIRGEVHLAGIPVNVADTAGLHETQDPIELQGIARAYTAISRADVVLFINDQPLMPENLLDEVLQRIKPGVLLIKVVNKRDLFEAEIGRILQQYGENAYAVSATSGEGIAELEAAIVSSLGLTDEEDGEFLARERHIEALHGARDAIRSARSRAAETSFASELIAEELRLAQRHMEGLVGKVDAEDLLGAIFSRFCVGK